MKPITSFKNLSKFETGLWITSVLIVTASGFFGGDGWLSTIASLIGVTALIFVSKGDVLGQFLTIVFAVLYGIISFSFTYYGEMLTYLCMTAPIAALAVISWIKNPSPENNSEVAVNRLKMSEIIFLILLTILVTTAFYFILSSLNTANIIPSTISVTTSFLASYLTFRRSRFYAVAYAANDIVLIVLWIMATSVDIKYLSMVICFLMFFINDMYGFIYWTKMKKRQSIYINKGNFVE